MIKRGSLSCPNDAGFVSFKGDFRRTREVFVGSGRGYVGALVWLTTSEIEWPRELIEEPGLIVYDVPGG